MALGDPWQSLGEYQRGSAHPRRKLQIGFLAGKEFSENYTWPEALV
jgi:hypothetical protein